MQRTTVGCAVRTVANMRDVLIQGAHGAAYGPIGVVTIDAEFHISKSVF
jgi:hypothetical protein